MDDSDQAGSIVFARFHYMKRILAPLLLLILAAGCSKMKDPEFKRLERFRVKKFGLSESTIGFNVVYHNPNNVKVTVKEAEADVYMDSVFLGRFVQDSLITVGKNAEFTIPFSGSISMQKALNLNLQDIGTRDIQIRAEGNVKVGKAGIFVNRPIRYQGKHRLDQIKLQ
ncbi:MAG TPA: LEA type 2 family protein [Flavisolibacter sp.]|nr:LEA type 2 family protein [Flavisolibacter sp.]